MDHTDNSPESGVWRRNLEGWARALFDGIDDAVFVHDLKGRILDVNAAACRRLGYTRDELLRMTTRDIDEPEFAAGFAGRLEEQLLTGRLRCEGRHRARDGRVILVDINSSIIDFRGKPCVLSVMRDVSDQKAAERYKAIQFSIAQAVMEARSLDNLEPLLLQTIGEGMGCDLAVLWVVEAAGQLLRFSNLWHRPDAALERLAAELADTRLARGEGLAGRVRDVEEPLWVPDLYADPLLERVRARFGNPRPLGGFAFPVWSSGAVTGVVSTLSRKPAPPDPHLLGLATSLGSQIGQLLELQRVDNALRESQAFYHSLVESLPQFLFRKDRDGRLTFANQRYCTLLNMPLEELIGKTDFDLFPEHLARKYREDDEKVLNTGRPLEQIEEHRTRGEVPLYVEVIKTPIQDQHGAIIGVQGLFWDVTERFKAELALSASERRYRQLTEATLDAIVVADHQGNIRLFNPAAEKLFGYDRHEVVGKPITALMPEDYRARHEGGMQRFLQTRTGRLIGKPVELEGLRKDGSRVPLEIVLSVLDADDGDDPDAVRFLGAIRDLTERNRMRSVLLQNEKLASIGLLSAGVAHEINNPLAFVGNNLAVLQRDLAGVMDILGLYQKADTQLASVAPGVHGEVRQRAEEIDLPYIQANLDRLIARTRDGVDRVAKIVQSLRGLARTGKPQRQLASVPDLVAASLEIVRNHLRKHNVQIETKYDADCTLSCVPTQLSQVFLNLLVNAAQAIESRPRPEGNWIKVHVRRLEEEMLIQVADDGCGIPAENLPHIFDPFFTTKEVGVGTGLGLSITHNIITAHGGRMEVNSTVGQGTVFRILLPLNPE